MEQTIQNRIRVDTKNHEVDGVRLDIPIQRAITVGFLRKLSGAAARVPSMGYALLYLALIPMFALIYMAMGEDFYHATSRYETYVRGDAEKILEEIKDSMASRIEQANGSTIIKLKDNGVPYTLDFVNATHFYDLRVERPVVSFKMIAMVIPEDLMLHQSGHGTHTISFELKDRRMREGFRAGLGNVKVFSDLDQFFRVTIDPPPQGVNKDHKLTLTPMDFFPHYKALAPGEAAIWLSDSMEKHIRDYADFLEGFPAATRGEFWRMFYLSAVTITTLGYGDIVPLTGRARAAVAIESILGVVTIGLFLTALASEFKPTVK